MKQKKILKRMLSIVLAAALIVPTTWVPAENNVAVSTAASSEVVYVSADNGDDSNAGTEAAPVKTLGKAFEVVANGGTVQIDGTYDGATSWSATGKAITITGGTLNFVTGNITLGGLGDTLTFKNITLGLAAEQRVFANGCKLTIGEGVVTTSSTDNAPYLYGGCAVGKGSLDGDSYLEVNSGTWKRIYGGGNDASIQSGDTHVIVGGTTTKVYAIYGSGMGDHIYGDTNVTVQGKVTAEYVYGGGSFSHHGTLAIDGKTNVIISEQVNIMSVNGGSNLVRGTDYMSLDVTTYCDTTVLMTGGTVQQVFGGNNTGPMTGDVDVRILGGEVTRRIYGGNYNDHTGTSFTTTYAVNGNIKLTIGDEANISFSETGLDGMDMGIFACSRNNPKPETEHTTIIYDNEAAQSEYEGKLGAQDGWAEGIMSGVDATDDTHRYEYTANDDTNTITATCTLCSEEHSEEATLEAIQDEFIYGGKAIKGAQVTYDEAWGAAPLDIVYANNEAAGTATATCMIHEQSVSVDFKIESTVLYGKTISILGDSISTFGGVSNNANMNSTIGKNNVYYSGGTKTSTGVIWQNQTYWGKVIGKYGMELCVNNSTGGGKVSADVGTDGVRPSGIKRSTELHNNEGQEPDIIIVYMGTNDLADNTSTSFKSAYKKMIDNIYARYENAEIFCFTLIPRDEQATYETRVTGYNNKIREVVSTYKDRVTLVDMYQELGLTWNNLSLYLRSDNLHPNPTGMEYISKVLERALLNEFDSESYPSTPEVYFDLALDVENDTVSNAVTDQNTTVSKAGDNGVVKNMTYIHEGKTCQIPVYYAPKDPSGNSYLDVEFKEVTGQSTDAAKVDKLSSMIFDNGITFECFVWVDGTTDSTAGLMTSMYSGGIGLCSINKGGGTNFQIGTTKQEGYGYKYGSKYVASNHNSSANALAVGKFSHVVGTYDKDTHVMTLYIDGQFIGSGTYGTGSFEKGTSKVGHIGIGTNLAALSESLDDDMNYAFADARIYKGALSQEQVIERYNTFWDEATESSVYFDLDFQDEDGDGVKEPVSVGTNKENTDIAVKNGGEITTMDVLHEGQICKVPVYSAESVSENQLSNHKYLDVAFSDIENATQMGDWLLKDGITFECFLYIEDGFVTGKSVGIMTNCYSGGVSLYNVKGQEGLNFLVGAQNFNASESYKYSGTYIGAVKHTEATATGKVQDCSLDEKAITHVVATITVVGDNKMMSLYKNGVLISEGKYTGTFIDGSIGTKGGFGHIGIGANVSEPSEGINYYSDYSIVDARIYSYGLTSDQVAAEYENRWNEVASYATEDEVPQLDNLSEYADVTTGNSQELEGLPTYYSGSNTSGIYQRSNSGDRAAGGDGDYTLHVFSNSAQAAYISYLKALEEADWAQYSNNVKENNLFATYTKDDDEDGIADRSVYAYYIANKKTTYIVASKTAYLENKAAKYEKVCEPQFTELKNISSSQCEILRLSDGRFIIIDSGMLETDHYQAKNIYKTLKEQNVLNKITIAAWIVTHAHTDHMDACADFLKVYGNAQVEVEEIIFNFPNKADREEADSANQPETTPKFFEALAIAQKKWPDMKIITCHTGQEYQFADATIEILHTPEDYFPTEIKDVKDGLNDSSVAFRIKIAGQTIMILGDAGTGVSNGMIQMWGDYLKSDFVQMAHHGMDGGIVPLYERIDPTVVTIPATRALWTTTDANYIGKYAPTKWALDNISGNIKEVCIAGLGTHTFKLPYTPQGENATIINAQQNGYNLEEGAKVKSEIPTPYADLKFQGTGVEVVSKENISNTAVIVGGSVGEQTVYYKGEQYKVTAYRGEKTNSDYHHIKLTMNNISTDDATGITQLLTGGNGHALEAFFALDAEPSSIGGVMSGCNGGGVSIYARKYGVIGYQLGSKHYNEEQATTENKYVYAADTESTKAKNNYTMPLGKTVVHVVATYDEENHKLNLYRNGVLMSSTDYSAEFNAANVTKMAYNTLGIGANIGSSEEAIGKSTGYTVIKSRVYDESLNAEQVAASYWNCIKELTGSDDETIYAQQTVSYTRDEANEFLSKGTYPRKDGYLFAGWYTTTDIPEIDVNNYDASVEDALKKVIKTEVPDTIDTVYALFVPEDVMTVKAQISENLIDNPNDEKGSIRFVTTVDSLLYQQAGFTVDYINSSGTPKNIPSVSNKVYDQLHAVDASGDAVRDLTYLPKQFCSVSKYFKACTVINLSNKNFEREFTVTPFWVTMDGSYVYGEPVIKSISQSPNMLK